MTLETERLRLRRHRADDLEACAAMWADPDVTAYIGGNPSTRTQAWARLRGYAGMWALLGYGYWAVEERATGTFVGELGFANFEREIVPTLLGPESGWVFVTRVHGLGYGAEALRAVVAWGDEHLAAATTTCIISPDNIASLRVAEKCGYGFARHAVLAGQAVLVYERAAQVIAPKSAIAPLLGLDHADVRVTSLDAVESFYDALLPRLGLTQKMASHVGTDGEWTSVDASHPRNAIEYATAPATGERGWFVGFIQDAAHVAGATRIAFALEREADLPSIERFVRDAGARVIEGSSDAAYPALFFEDPAGTRLEICARRPQR